MQHWASSHSLLHFLKIKALRIEDRSRSDLKSHFQKKPELNKMRTTCKLMSVIQLNNAFIPIKPLLQNRSELCHPTEILVFQHFFLQIKCLYKVLRSGNTSCSCMELQGSVYEGYNVKKKLFFMPHCNLKYKTLRKAAKLCKSSMHVKIYEEVF